MKKWVSIFFFLIATSFLQACENEDSTQNRQSINKIEITYDQINHTVTTKDQSYDVSFFIDENIFEIKAILKDGYYFGSNIEFFINDVLINIGDLIVAETYVSYRFIENNELPIYKDIQVILDPNFGYFTAPSFDMIEKTYELRITKMNQETGEDVTLIDRNQSGYRWFYKLFIKYHDQIEAYEIVYVDYRTMSIDLLNLPEYDFVIGVTDQTIDTVAKVIVMSYALNFKTHTFISFDKDLTSYQEGELVASIYDKESLTETKEVIYHHPTILPIPFKFEHNFIGWSDGEHIYQSYPGFFANEDVSMLTLTAVYQGYDIEDVILFIDSKIPDVIQESIFLPETYSDYEITYFSSHPDILSHEGYYQRPYLNTSISLEVTFTSNDYVYHKTYDLEASGYKELSTGIASSYIYRNYSLVDDLFFETLDIINCAFMIAQIDGSITGSNFLSNVTSFIMPKAKKNGNWVILSIAPESAWSIIAANQNLINTFADNIVSIINMYGFDGVDIDWETPTNDEKTRYTSLMSTVYFKVKENNPNHLVTTAITGGMWQPPRYDLLNSLQYIDYINMMTYGMVSSNGYYQNPLSPSGTYHDPLHFIGRTLNTCSIEESIQIFKNQFNVPVSKIIVGVAFYGIKQQRTYQSATQSWSSWSNAGSIHYTEIFNLRLNIHLYEERFDEVAGVPYLVKKDFTEFISYDNPRSILLKSEWIIREKVGGMMFWEYGTDLTNELLLAMKQGLKT